MNDISMSDIYMNLACAFLAMAFIMRNFLFLRMLSIMGSLFLITYNLTLINGTSWVQVRWESAFITINCFHLYIIIKDTFLIRLSLEEKELHQSLFSFLSAKQFLNLRQFGEWENLEIGHVIIQEGDTPSKMYVLKSGNCEIIVDQKIVAHVDRHDFICEMNYISGEVASATVKVKEPARVLSFNIEKLKKDLHDETTLSALIGAIGKNLAKKIKIQNKGPL